MNTYKNKIEHILEIEGVNAIGYGIISQAAMFDRDISVQSKAIYAYLVSYTGSGRTIFPKRETILADLKMSVNTFYKHFSLLVKNGYISVAKAKGFINKNVYTVCNNPTKINCSIESHKTDSLLALDGINAKGYGFIPKLIMCDNRLDVKAKALIAFFYSLVQAGGRAFPHRQTICVYLGLSKNSYYKALNQLIDCNYITVKQRHTKKGRFTVNDYILNSNPKKSPCPKNCDNEKSLINTDVSPCPKNCDNTKAPINTDVSPCPKNCDNTNHRVSKIETLPCPQNCDNNNITSINSNNNISSSNLEDSYIPYTQDAEKIKDLIYKLTRFEDYSSCKDDFARKYCRTVKALVEMLCVIDHAKYGNRFIKTPDLFDYLNDCIVEDIDGVSLRDLICQTVCHFDLCCDKYEIRRPAEYLKALIWDEIYNFDL